MTSSYVKTQHLPLSPKAFTRRLKVVPNDSRTQVSYLHFIHCFASTALETELLPKNDFYDMTSS